MFLSNNKAKYHANDNGVFEIWTETLDGQSQIDKSDLDVETVFKAAFGVVEVVKFKIKVKALVDDIALSSFQFSFSETHFFSDIVAVETSFGEIQGFPVPNWVIYDSSEVVIATAENHGGGIEGLNRRFEKGVETELVEVWLKYETSLEENALLNLTDIVAGRYVGGTQPEHLTGYNVEEIIVKPLIIGEAQATPNTDLYSLEIKGASSGNVIEASSLPVALNSNINVLHRDKGLPLEVDANTDKQEANVEIKYFDNNDDEKEVDSNNPLVTGDKLKITVTDGGESKVYQRNITVF